jgi:CRP-like cAMP-binding protein
VDADPEEIIRSWQSASPMTFEYTAKLSIASSSVNYETAERRRAHLDVDDVIREFESNRSLLSSLGARNARQSDLSRHESESVYDAMTDLIVDQLGFEFFDQFSTSHVKDIVKIMEMRHVHEQEWVFHKGQAGDEFFLIFNGKVGVYIDESSLSPVAELGPGKSFGEAALLNNAPRNASILTSTKCLFGVISRGPFTKAIMQQKLLEENRITDFLATRAPFCLIPSRRTWKYLPLMRHHRVQIGKPVFHEMPPLWMVLRGVVRILGTVTFQGYLNGHQRTIETEEDERNVGLRVFHNVPLLEFHPGQYFGLSETVYGKETRVLANNVCVSNLKAVAISDGKCVSFSKDNLLEILKKETDLDLALFHSSRAQRIFEADSIFQILYILDKDDFGRKSAQYLQQILDVCVQFPKKLPELPVFKDLVALGHETQERESLEVKLSGRVELMKDTLRLAGAPVISEETRYKSWREAPARKANETGTYFHRVK